MRTVFRSGLFQLPEGLSDLPKGFAFDRLMTALPVVGVEQSLDELQNLPGLGGIEVIQRLQDLLFRMRGCHKVSG